MTAQITYDQAGLPAGVPGRARTDGLATGVTVVVTNGSGRPCRCELWWWPPNDVAVASTLVQVAPNQWEFTPTASRYGEYAVRMVEDENTATQTEDIKIFGVRYPVSGLLLPSFNSRGDTRVNRASTMAEKLAAAAASFNNEPLPDDATVDWSNWWQSQRELYDAVEMLAGGSGGGPADAEYLVGVAHAGLSAERVVTDTVTIVWDLTTPGLVSAGIPGDAVTNAILANMAEARVKGRAIGMGTGDPVDLTPDEVADIAIAGGITTDDILVAAGITIPEVGATLTEAIQWLGEGHRYFSPTYLSPLAQWNPGITLVDQTANGLDLTLESGTSRKGFAESIQSFYFDGATNLVGPAAGSALQRIGSLTILTLVRVHAVQAAGRTLFQYAASGDTEPTNSLYSLAHNHASYNLSCFTESGPGDDSVSVISAILVPSPGVMSMLGIRMAAPAGGSIAVDFVIGGRTYAGTSVTTPSGGTTAVLRVGSGPALLTPFVGEMYSMVVFDATRTDQEIANIYNHVLGGVDGPEPHIFT